MKVPPVSGVLIRGRTEMFGHTGRVSGKDGGQMDKCIHLPQKTIVGNARNKKQERTLV